MTSSSSNLKKAFLNLGRTFVAHSTGLEHPVATQVICQSGEMLIWHVENSILRIHHG
jgi:hypothetical protein